MEPIVSIIIPVRNNLHFTDKCLLSISEAPPTVPYEIIVVDNASDDGTKEFLENKMFEGELSFITNSPPMHFAVSCNQGAQLARGRYLLFLNNDIEAFPGWLDAMVSVMESNGLVGAVGAKLLFADRTIQHAGVVFYTSQPSNKVIPYHIYKNFPKDAPAVSKQREFQCVTGACLLTPKDVFKTVGGFDPAYINCFEDVDYCLKLKEAGFKIFYTPEAELIHYEGQTPGRSDRVRDAGIYFWSKWEGKLWADDHLYLTQEGFSKYEESPGNIVIILGPELKSWWDLINQLLGLEQYELAITEIEKIQQIVPGNVDISETLGRCHFELGHFDEARAAYNAALTYDQNRVETMLGLTKIAIAEKKYLEASTRLQVMISTHPGDSRRPDWTKALHDILNIEIDSSSKKTSTAVMQPTPEMTGI